MRVMETLALIGFVGGIITGISPCVLPVLPVIFFSGGAQSARTIDSEGNTTVKTAVPRAVRLRPYLVIAGLVLSFATFTLLGSLLLSALGLPQDFLRWAGLVVLVLIGLGLIFPHSSIYSKSRSRGSLNAKSTPAEAVSSSDSHSAPSTYPAQDQCSRRSP